MDKTRLKRWCGAGLSLLITILAVPNDVEARGSGCSKSASRQLRACRQEAHADFWTEVAKAEHLPNSADRREAINEARKDLHESLVECRDRYRERIALCRSLGEKFYHPDVDPVDFEVCVPNPYFPLDPGVTRIYTVETDEGLEEVHTTVTDETREILGVVCATIHDVAFLEGEPIEDTLDYYACDSFGNIWYFGEDSVEIEDGIIVSTHGSWIAGEDGAKPGIIMKATPMVGDVYRQEFAAGEAEDAGEVIALSEEVTVPYGTFVDCLVTGDFTPIEPGVSENKYYAPGVGTVLEVNPETGEELALIDVIVE